MPTHTLLTRVAAALTWAAIATAIPAGAQQRTPADAAAPVPEIRYRAAATYRPAAPEASTPDRNWQALNRAVAGYESMAPTMPGASGTAPPDHAGHAGHAGHAHKGHHAAPGAHAGHARRDGNSSHQPAAEDPHAGHGQKGQP